MKNDSLKSKDYALRIDVDPGESYPAPGYAPSSVHWAQFIEFLRGDQGYLGLQRLDGKKKASVTIWGAANAKSSSLRAINCVDHFPCRSLRGDYDWKVGHKYRFRVELSPRTPSDKSGDWWQVTLADLTLGKMALLGEIKTPKWGGLSRTSGIFIAEQGGPYPCNFARHSKITEGQVKGNFGQDAALAQSSATVAADPDICDKKFILPEMTYENSGSTVQKSGKTLLFVENNYRGLHQWGAYRRTAHEGMMFIRRIKVAEPYIFRARHDGNYGPLPAEGADNSDWKSVGRGYPIINDLYFRNQRVYNWEERAKPFVKIGNYFMGRNPKNGDTEFFKLLSKPAHSFPTDKSSNGEWTYVGRYPQRDEPLSPALTVHQWSSVDQTGKKGWLYYANETKKYYILQVDGSYSSFPTKSEDNRWWTFVGYHR